MKNNELHNLNIIEAIDGLRNGDFTSLELTRSCLTQIKKFEPEIKAFVTILEEQALHDANEADNLIQKEGPQIFEKKPLLGIPYAVKDNFCTKGVETTASSNILKGFVPPYESTVTFRIKDAGAILLGKTNMDAFAHGASTETSDFFSTKNPWDKRYVPGGSSGGSTAAVAANMCIFAIGSETAGSIRGPASWCGVTGLKPSYGRVSRYGVIAMASSTDSPGPVTKTSIDAAYILGVIAGKDSFDATTSVVNPEDYYSELLKTATDIKGTKIGVPKSYFVDGINPEVEKQVKKAIQVFSELGAEIKEIDLIDPKYGIGVYTIIQRAEVSSNLGRFSGVRFGHERDKFGQEARKRIMLGSYVLSAGYYDKYYAKAQKVRSMIIEDFSNAFEEVDVILAPTLHDIAQVEGVASEHALFGEYMDMLVEPSAVAGLAAISIPCGFAKSKHNSKLPVGVQLMSPQDKELDVLKVSNAYQQVTEFHTNFPEMGKDK